MDLQLQGKRALVTGSTAGISWAIARELATEGVAVVVNGRDRARTARAIKRLCAAVPGAQVDAVQADVGTADGCAHLAEAAGDVDILVDHCGIFDPRPFEQIDDAKWQHFVEVNVMSGVRLSRALLPAMKARNWGRIVCVSSESDICPPAEMVHSGMTKSAQLSVSRGLAETCAGSGVTVNAVLPPDAYRGRRRVLRPAGKGCRPDAGRSRERLLHPSATDLAAQALHRTAGSGGDGGLCLQPARQRHQRSGVAGRRWRGAHADLNLSLQL